MACANSVSHVSTKAPPLSTNGHISAPPPLPVTEKGYSLRPVREASALDCASCFAGALIHINNRNNMLKHILPFSQRQESLEKGVTEKALIHKSCRW